jgi:hypothetical protein
MIMGSLIMKSWVVGSSDVVVNTGLTYIPR